MGHTINVSVRNKIAVAPKDALYICGNSDFVVVFDFDDEWAEYDAKTARFKYNGTYQDIVFTGNECEVPVISNTYNIEVGVFAGDLRTTTPAYVSAKKSILCGSGVPDDPPEDVYNQIMELLKTRPGGGSGGTVELDNTLTQEGMAADAAAVGNKLVELSTHTVSYVEQENVTEEMKAMARHNIGAWHEGVYTIVFGRDEDDDFSFAGVYHNGGGGPATGEQIAALYEDPFKNVVAYFALPNNEVVCEAVYCGKNDTHVRFYVNNPADGTEYLAEYRLDDGVGRCRPIQTGGGNVDLSEYVKSVNGNKPDENGNVQIAVSGGTAVAPSVVKMSNILNVGQVFDKPEGRPYCGWPFNNLQYDPDLNAVVFIINAATKHGDNGVNSLYMGKLNLDTYAAEIKEIGNPDTLGHGFYTMGFCINNKGEYLYIDAQSATLGKSVNKGETWTETSVSQYSTWPESITQLSNGRYLFWSDTNNGVWYSDDECVSWTKATMNKAKYEGYFLELTNGTVMCFMRKSTNGTDNGAWSGTKIQEPIVISVSHDYGATWTDAKDSTTLLEGCANIATAFYHKDEDLVEVFTSPRYPYGDTKGAIWQYIATREDALNDNFGTPKAVLYSRAIAYQDFGHIGGCKDSNGDMHLMYYDGDSSESGSVNYYALKAYRDCGAVKPNTDHNIVSKITGWTSFAVAEYAAKVLAPLKTQIAEIALKVGLTPEQGEEGSLYVADGLQAHWDFLDPTTRKAASYSVLDKVHSIPIYLNENMNEWSFTVASGDFDSYFDEHGLNLRAATKTESMGTDLADFSTNKKVGTVEMLIYRTDADTARLTYVITSGVQGKRGQEKLAFGAIGDIRVRYTNTSGAISEKVVKSVGIDKNSYTHIVVTFDGSVIKSYKNGVLVETVDMATTVTDFADFGDIFTNFGILAFATTKCRLYSKPLTADEVRNNYKYERNVVGF